MVKNTGGAAAAGKGESSSSSSGTATETAKKLHFFLTAARARVQKLTFKRVANCIPPSSSAEKKSARFPGFYIVPN